MFLSKVSINRPVMTTMGLMVFLIFGLIAYFTLNLNLQPDVEIPYVTISTVYPGAGPKEIEVLISKRIEETVSTISQIRRVESYSLDGLSIVIMEFKLGKNVDVANQEVKDKIDEILNDLPEDARAPIVQKVDFKQFPVVEVSLSGDLNPRELWDIADKTLKDRFSQIEGVAKVNITGGQEREIRIALNNRVAFENNISLPQLMQILKMYNMDIPGGYFKLDDQEYTVRLEGEFQDIETMKEIQVPTPFGPKKLRQFATIEDGGKDIRQRAVYYDNINKVRDENMIRLGIVKSSEGNVVQVADAVRNSLPDIQAALPAGAKIQIIDDASVFVKSSVDDTMSNIYLGVIFTGLVLFLFLHDWRSTFIVALSMPTSIISTFLLLQMSGLTLNMMTLMGLSVSVGVLVANSIVVIENIFRYKKLGKDNREAAFLGTNEVVVAVLASTLTNLVVFLPVANMSSMVGMWLRELALAAVFATIFSLIMSFTLTPMLASLIIKETHHKRRWAVMIEKWEEMSTRWYSRMLGFVLKSKLVSSIVIAGTFITFILVMMIFGPRVGFEFLPTIDDGKLAVQVELPEGYNLDETARVLSTIEERIKKYPEVKYILTDLGKKSDLDLGANMASVIVQLVDVKDRDVTMSEMVPVFVGELADIPNARIAVDFANNMGGPGAPITFYLLGQDLDKLEELKNEIMVKIKDVPGLINLDQSSRAGKPEITVYPKRDKMIESGLSTMDLALTLRSSVEGMVSSKYRELGNEYDITVTLNDESVNGPEKIGNITVVSPVMGAMRLSQVADIKFTTGYTKILHREKFTTIMFTGSPASGVPIGNVTNEIESRLETVAMPPGYSIKWGGSVEMMNDMIADMIFAFFLAVLLTYMLLAAILESFWQPVLIMLTVLLAMIGVILSLFITGTSFSVTSLMAIIMLIGIVVNNAILLLDYTNQLRREQGYSSKDALLEAGPVKLKPQLMASVAIILGMLPMALGIGDAGREMRIPMGVVAIGGLMVSTVLTLFVIPAFYYVTSKAGIKVKTKTIVG
jgi:hydrophobic/amphiphilic exporter-1 (mainly G- bacteria), HAE1 family